MSIPGQFETLTAALDFHATVHGDVVALVDDRGDVTYDELRDRSRRVADGLLAAGVTRGSRVAYLGRDSSSFFEILYGCAQIGAVIVPVNWKLAVAEIEFIVSDSQAVVLFADSEVHSSIAISTAAVIPLGRSVFDRWRSSRSAAAPANVLTGNDPVAQMYTSGTTGTPKGVVLAGRTFFAVERLLRSAELDWIDWRDDDVSLVALPSFHIGGLWWATQGLNAGVTNILLGAFSGRAALEAIRTHRVTTTCLVPAMILMLLSEPEARREEFTSLRKIVYGGSPIGRSLLNRAIEILDCDLAQIYGLTETGNTAVCLPPSEHSLEMSRVAAAGRAYPGVDLEVRRTDGVPAEVGEIGEVFLRSPAQMIEYWNRPEATDETLVSGWVRTGDAGYVDEEGYLFICDRVKDMIIVAGENVYPAEVENSITSHPSVHDAAVIGVPDERWGESVRAYVVPLPGHSLTTRDIVKHVSGRVAAYKLPSRYEFVEEIPRNASGKILRRTLRERFWSNHARQVN